MNRIRIVHSADIHLDASFSSLGVSSRIGNRLREAQRTVFLRILRQTREWPADMLIFSGDLFEEAVSYETLSLMRDAFEQLAPTPVYIVPGNRDSYSSTSPYATELWPDNVHMFTPGSWQRVKHPSCPVMLHGMGCGSKENPDSWPASLQIPEDDYIHIVAAHASERFHQPETGKRYAPFDAADLHHPNLTYAAMGHFHNMTVIDDKEHAIIAYPGTPQGRNFNECGERYCLQVEMNAEPGSRPNIHITPVAVQEVVFTSCTCAYDDSKTVEAMLAPVRLEAKSNQDQVAQVRLTGGPAAPVKPRMDAFKKQAGKHLLHLELKDETDIAAIHPIIPPNESCEMKTEQQMQARLMDTTERSDALRERHARDLMIAAHYNPMALSSMLEESL